MEKAELVITALQQRIGEIVSSYETQNAILRALLYLLHLGLEENLNQFYPMLLFLSFA
jgi:hypothetical protein